MNLYSKVALCLVCFTAVTSVSFAQADLTGSDFNKSITTAVPFLNITPDARAGAMGDAGVATSPDQYSMHWNPSKLAFMENDMGFAITHNPWLSKLVNDMSLSYLTGYKHLRKEDVIGVSLKYFDLGSITFTDDQGATIRDFDPREFSISAAYSRMLGQGFSAGLALKYIRSNLAGNFSGNNGNSVSVKPGNTAAADVSFYYRDEFSFRGKKMWFSSGINISNIGAKISYSDVNDDGDFIPTNIRIGSAFKTEIDEYNTMTFTVDANKLMVPSPNVEYENDSVNDVRVPIRLDNQSDKPLLNGMFGSFSDADGGTSEEFNEITWSFGVEYWYNDLFAARGGYFYESPNKGNRQYFTMGIGLRFQVFGLDFGYLISTQQDHPLDNTLRFALSFSFDKDERAKTESVTE